MGLELRAKERKHCETDNTLLDLVFSLDLLTALSFNKLKFNVSHTFIRFLIIDANINDIVVLTGPLHLMMFGPGTVVMNVIQ